ncbi:MAG: apolipoprotein N-acyltransferase, partial [Mycobacterium sp.]|nr:apolipoprotein N-acyltransferase [Mycobacterium sp.]
MGLRWGALRQRFPGWATAFVFGTLPAFAFPAPSCWWLAWIGLVPLLLAVRAAPTPWAGAVRAWLGMGAFVLTTQYWLVSSIGPALALLAIGLGALWVPWGWVGHWLLSPPPAIGRSVAALVVAPSAWVAAEAVRSLPSLGGPWASLGASQWNQPVTLASASLGGVWLTSFLLVATNTAIVGVILHRRAAGRLVMSACVVACAGLGPAWYLLGPAPDAAPTVRVALVQTGDIADVVARQAASEALTATLAGQRPDLVVWGESSVGQDLTNHPEVLDRLSELSRRVGADLLVNVDARAPSGGIYKSAVLVGEHGSLGSYRKIRLVPFGEYVPLRPLFGWITRHSKAAAEDRQRGSGPVVLHAGRLAIGPLISYETTFPDLTRREEQLGAELLVYQ